MTYPLTYYSESNIVTILQSDIENMGDVFFNMFFEGIRLLFLSNGYILFDTQDKEKAKNIVNSFFFSASLLYGPQMIWPIGVKEFDSVKFDEERGMYQKEIKIISPRHFIALRSSLRREMENELKEYGMQDLIYIKNTKMIEVSLDLAREIFKSTNRDGLMLFYNAWYHTIRGEYTSSFISNWIVIELTLSRDLIKYLKERGTPSDNIKRIEKDWTVATIIQFLLKQIKRNKFDPTNDKFRFSKEELEECDMIRNIRNNIIHDGYEPTEEETNKCYNLSNKCIWRLMRLDGINYQEYFDRKA